MGKKRKGKARRHPKHRDGAWPGHDGASASVAAARSTAGPTDAATELAADLVGIGAQLQRQLGHGVDDDGLTRARLSALNRLVLGGPCGLGELATREGVRPPTMTRLVHAMEAAGLVERERHPTDGRMILLRATTEGEALLASGQVTRLTPLASAIAGLDRDERTDLEQASAVLGRFLRDLSGARRRT